MPLFSFFRNFFKRIKQKKQAQAAQNMDQKLVASVTSHRFPRLNQLKFLPSLLNKKERWALKIGLLAAILGLIAFGVSFIENPKHQTPAQGGVFREGILGYPRFINPILPLTEADKDLSRLIFSSLLVYNAQGELVGDLAKSYDISPDGKTYTFSLKDASWHDGEPVLANDIVFTIKTIQDPAWRSSLWRSFRGIQVEAVDDQTIKFQLDKPFASFPSLLTVGIIPLHIWQSVNPENFSLAVWNIQPVGSGPWRFQNLTKTKTGQILSYTLEKNQDFYGQTPWLDKLTFFFYDNLESAIQALKESRIDALPFVPQTAKEKLPLKRVNAFKMGLPTYTAVFFNERRNSFLETQAIRQALSLMINKEDLAKLTGGEPVSGPLPPDLLTSAPISLQKEFNEPKAAELLKTAGFELKDNFWQKKDVVITVNLTLIDDPFYQSAAEFIKTAWEKNGVKTILNVLPAKDFKQTVKNRSYEALLWSQILNHNFDLFPFWHSSQIDDPGLNLTSFRNRAGDTLLEEVRTNQDPQKRLALSLDFLKIIDEQTPAVFLFHPIHLYAISKKVGGVQLDNLNSSSERFAGLNDWFVKKRLKF
ncbi:MAG: ABC transporter substrate-binding protein [bacterium]|nr:ABC transporter substrate-binding protein [bacterium]